jgi:hypothetical protein
MKRSEYRSAYPLVAAALVGSMLPLTGLAAASADDGDDASTPQFSGYSTTGVASPLKIEVFEPTIPIPNTPQGELDLGYTKIKADSSSTKGRASFMWPGDPVGEGFKTFVEQLGLPPQLGEKGYPVQVNSQFPGDTTKEEQAPFPGTSMTAESADKKAHASVGFSSNCDVSDGASGGDTGGGEGAPPGLPGIPGLPTLPELPVIGDLLNAIPGLGARESTVSRGAARADDGDGGDAGGDAEASCQIPAALAALVDVGGYIADTQSAADDSAVVTTSRTALGDVRLIGGLVTMSGITSTTMSTSDGTTGAAKGRADYGTMTIAGQTFGIGPEGFIAAGQSGPIPGLPDDPTAALATLGITVTVPKPTYKVVDDKAVGTVEGLIVSIDLKTLSPALRNIQLGPILNQLPFPPEAAPLKSALGAIGNLSPRVVLHLAYTTATVDTVQGIDIPDTVPDNDPGGDDDSEDTGGSAAGGATGGGAGTGGTGAVPPADTGTPTTDAADGTLTDAALASGLPPLFSIPGLLMALGLGGALLAGSYVRKIGAMALGGAGACSHGLDSGLPDLRKVQ